MKLRLITYPSLPGHSSGLHSSKMIKRTLYSHKYLSLSGKFNGHLYLIHVSATERGQRRKIQKYTFR